MRSFYDIGYSLSDKVNHHRYDRFYPLFLESLRDQEFNMLEIGVWGGGSYPAVTNVIQFITIATTGNAQEFGDLSVARSNGGGASSPTRLVFAGGYAPSKQDTIDYVTISTTGNAIDFGNMSSARHGNGGCSNGHGGL